MTDDRFKPVRDHLADARKHLAGVAAAAALVRRVRVVGDKLDPSPRVLDDVRASYADDPDGARVELLLIVGELHTLKAQQQSTATQVRSRNEAAAPNKAPLPGMADAIGKIDSALTILNAWCEC